MDFHFGSYFLLILSSLFCLPPVPLKKSYKNNLIPGLEDSNYCEWTVTPKYLFQYCDSAQPTKHKISLTNNTLTITPNLKWTIKEFNKEFLLVDINHSLLRLFPKQSHAGTVKSLYDFLHDEHNENAATVFIRDANERKQQLIDKTTNGL